MPTFKFGSAGMTGVANRAHTAICSGEAIIVTHNVEGKGLAATHPTYEKVRVNRNTKSKPLTTSPA
ncbi:MAG: hypothetical protein Q7U74_13575 [Saprospiraceae bacterium]|nr:hypothetical protein [Saprospiraceae bacterium]